MRRAGTATGASWGTGALVRITPLSDAAVVGTAERAGLSLSADICLSVLNDSYVRMYL